MEGKQKNQQPYNLRPRVKRVAKPTVRTKRVKKSVAPVPRTRKRASISKHILTVAFKEQDLHVFYLKDYLIRRKCRVRVDIDGKNLVPAFRIIVEGKEVLHLFYCGDRSRLLQKDDVEERHHIEYEFMAGVRVHAERGFACERVFMGWEDDLTALGYVEFRNSMLFLYAREQKCRDDAVPATAKAANSAPLQSVILESSDEGSDEDTPGGAEVPHTAGPNNDVHVGPAEGIPSTSKATVHVSPAEGIPSTSKATASELDRLWRELIHNDNEDTREKAEVPAANENNKDDPVEEADVTSMSRDDNDTPNEEEVPAAHINDKDDPVEEADVTSMSRDDNDTPNEEEVPAAHINDKDDPVEEADVTSMSRDDNDTPNEAEVPAAHIDDKDDPVEEADVTSMSRDDNDTPNEEEVPAAHINDKDDPVEEADVTSMSRDDNDTPNEAEVPAAHIDDKDDPVEEADVTSMSRDDNVITDISVEPEIVPVVEPVARKKPVIVSIVTLKRRVRIVRSAPPIFDEPQSKRHKILELLGVGRREEEGMDILNDTILVEDTPETSTNEDQMTRPTVIIPETPDNSIEDEAAAKVIPQKSRIPDAKDVPFPFIRVENVPNIYPSSLYPRLPPRELQRREPIPPEIFYSFQKATGTAVESVAKDLKTLDVNDTSRQVVGRNTPKLRNEKSSRRIPVAANILRSIQKIADTSSFQNQSDRSVAESVSDVSTCSNYDSTEQSNISYLLLLMEELKEAGHNALAEQLRIIKSGQKIDESMTQRSHTDSLHTGYMDKLQESYPDIHEYLLKLKVIGCAFKVNERTLYQAPVLTNWLNSAATERIFSKLLLHWKAQPKPKGKQKQRLWHNYKKIFKKVYPTGDVDYFLDHGIPTPLE